MRTDLGPSVIGKRLRELPAQVAPPSSWKQFQPRLAERLAEQRPASRYTALAAVVMGLIAGLALWGRLTTPTDTPQPAAVRSEPPLFALASSQSLAQAQATERWLARLPAEPTVMRVGTRGAVADLEDRIAWMDDMLSDQSLDVVDPSRLAALQRERTRLVDSLAQVRYAETLAANLP